MAKCKRCGEGNLFTKVNDIGLCTKCQNEYNMYIDRHVQILSESNKIISTTDNLSTKFSRAKLVLEKFYIIRDFCNENFDIYKETTGISIYDIINLQKDIVNDLSNAYYGFVDIILTFLNDEGTKTKKEIIDLINSTLDEVEGTLPYDINKTVASILDDLEYKQRISKEKNKNRYHYSIKLDKALN